MLQPPLDPSSSPVFEVSDLGYRYPSGAEAVRCATFSIERGEMVGMIGPNGAGKSTLLHLMNGLLRPSSGRVLLDGEEVSRIDPRLRARGLAYVPQSPRVFFPYTVAEIVAMGRHPYIGPFSDISADDRSRIAWAMEVTGTTAFARRRFNELSGGESQRVVIARALAQDAPALILDEPTSSLDLHYQSAVYGLLERLNREQGLTILIVTHDINLAAEYCRRLIGLRDGRVLMDGSVEAILRAEEIKRLYEVEADVIVQGGARLVRVRHEVPHG